VWDPKLQCDGGASAEKGYREVPSAKSSIHHT
jgi:hypothetical protein